MMTILMDKMSTPPRELVQRLYNKNIELEKRRQKAAHARIPSDPNAWQQMRENYEAIIIEDHTFSERHEVEYALWQLHYRRIEELRAHFSAALASPGSTTSQGEKDPARPDRITKIRSQFKIFLSEATGFYHDLILKIRSKYGLPLGNFSDDSEDQTILTKDAKKSAELKKGLLSCHHCLIYLGDLARYKGLYGEGDSKARDYAAASSYYTQAASLWPSSGNPHHQLAILASYSGNDLIAIYRYFRSLAVDSPFSTARENLIIAFEKNRLSCSQLPGETKVSPVRTPVRTRKGRGKGDARILSKDTKVEEVSTKDRARTIPDTYKAFCIRFVRVNGILFTRTSLETFGEVSSLVMSDLYELLSSGPEEELNFGSDAAENGLLIVRLIAILIFTVHNVHRETEGQSYAEILQRSVLLQNAFTATFNFVGHILKRCIQLKNISSSFLLPGILVFVEWLACCPDIAAGSDAEEKQAAARSFFWNQCISFLNKLILSGFVPIDDTNDESCFVNMSTYDEGETGNRLALWEDFELRGFLPLIPAQLILDFSRKRSFGSDGGSKEIKARVQRILAAGKSLINIAQIDHQRVYFDQKLKKFSIGVEPEVTEEFMLTTTLDVPKSNGMMHEPKAQLYMEGEDEDEEIVFKPTMTEKHTDANAPKLTYNVPEPPENTPKTELGTYVGSVLVPPSTLHLTSYNGTLQHLLSTNPSDSKWLVEQRTFLSNGLKNLSFLDNGHVMKPDINEGLGVSQPPALSIPYPQSLNLPAASIFSGQTKALETTIPSRFESLISSGANADNLIVNTSSAFPTNLRKNPVSRPGRHYGPPPGFNSFPSKQLDESWTSSELKIDSPPMDDYSWLDGYQSSSSTKEVLNNSINHSMHTYPHLNNSHSSTGTISFPFPGKQVPSVDFQVDNHKGWQDYQFLEHLKSYQLGNQQSTPLLEQNQGQSLWAGPFFV